MAAVQFQLNALRRAQELGYFWSVVVPCLTLEAWCKIAAIAIIALAACICMQCWQRYSCPIHPKRQVIFSSDAGPPPNPYRHDIGPLSQEIFLYHCCRRLPITDCTSRIYVFTSGATRLGSKAGISTSWSLTHSISVAVRVNNGHHIRRVRAFTYIDHLFRRTVVLLQPSHVKSRSI